MSGYPYGHGQWPPPQQAQPPPLPPQYQQPPSTYVPPYQQPYQQPYEQFPPYDYNAPSHLPPYQLPPQPPPQMPPQIPPVSDYYASSQNAFDYNANQNAGLGIAPPPGRATPNAPPTGPGWGQAPPSAAAAPPSGYAPYQPPPAPEKAEIPASGSFQELFQSQHTPSQAQPVYAPPPPARPPQAIPHVLPPAPTASKPAARSEESELEEGELSDGAELYDSLAAPRRDASASNPAPSKEATAEALNTRLETPAVLSAVPAADAPSRDASVIDLQEDTFYDEDDEPGEIKSNENGASASDAADADDEDMGFSDSEQRTTPAPGQQRMSYSPHLSPREVGSNKNSVAGDNTVAAKEPAEVAVNGKEPTAEAAQNDTTPEASDAGAALSATKAPFSNIDEAKREAQRAILGLISYGVNYQTYVDEGFDGKIIKSLFAELGLKSAPTPAPESPKPTTPEALPSTKKTGNTSNQEERKDRIARLLALKASKPPQKPSPQPAKAVLPAKPAAVPLASAPASESASAPAPAPAPTQQAKPEKTKSEKERLLQQKLEALRRTQKRAAATAAPPQPATARPNDKPADESAPIAEPQPRQGSAPTAPALQAPLQPSLPLHRLDTAAQGALPAQKSNAPVLSSAMLSHSSPSTAASARKRPVAADFDDFSAPSNPLKRPFGQMRQESSSLVIDVSDDSDSDVEMEVESQTDEQPSRNLQDGKPSRSNGSFRDFPPLSTTPFQPRQFGRPGSSMPTPPNGPANSKTADDEYARKLKQIQEMKRKIAEAEAKKARSSSTGSQTPKTGDSSPPEPESAPKFPIRRAISTGDVPKEAEDAAPAPASAPPPPRAPSADELFAEAVSARLPKPSDTSSTSSCESQFQSRARIASHQLPRVEASLQEKMFKLKLFQDKIAALQSEIDAGLAEKQRLTQEMGELDKESPAHTPHPVPEESIAAQAVADDVVMTTSPAAMDLSDNEAGQEDAGVASAEVTQDVAQQRDDDNLLPAKEEAPSAAADATESDSPLRAEASAPAGDAEDERKAEGEAETEENGNDALSKAEDTSESADSDELSEDSSSDADSGDDDVAMEDAADESEEQLGEQPDKQLDECERQPTAEQAASLEVGIVSPPGIAGDSSGTPLTKPCEQFPVSAVASSAPPALSTLTPYESPLRYFRSYRFHPRYREDIRGGLKSLTYSGRIEPDTELCPTELQGAACPDPSCRFQHFASIVPQDDQILVELGRSDDFTGDQKAQFVTGLRDVLKRFRDAKVRDFDTIAYEIIGFRRQFLGDDSKVVSHLEDVTL